MRARALLGIAVFLLACGDEPAHVRPDARVAGVEPDTAAGPELYSCGMHPHVLKEGPGTCPICGMELTLVGRSAASPARSSGERRIKYWVAPMDPTYIRDAPGKSPMGMDLVPVYEDAAPGGDDTLAIDPTVVQSMGVRSETVRRQTVFRHVRSIGEVEVGEDRLSVINLRFEGWAEKVHVDRTGDPVESGQPLLEIYSPELVAAQEEYLLAVRTQGARSSLARAARRKFELWGLAPEDVQAIEKSGVRRTFPIRSPRDGFVLHKDVVEGARISEGTDIYRIGDLSRIWVTAEVYEFDAPWVEVGQPAQMELAYEEGRVLEGRVAYIYPMLNEMSRTLRVRLEFENPDLRLRPGMFATVYIQYRRVDDVVAVPNEAILDSGRRKLVFVETGPGRFEPREIVTGLTGDRRLTEVRSGLEEGERVVLSGQFLLDSESQLQEAIRKMLERRAGRSEPARSEPERTLYACPMHPEVQSLEPGRCTLCGMDLEPRPATPEEVQELLGGAAAGTESPADPHPAHAGTEESANSSGSSAAPDPYTCPVHPEVTATGPGRCPVCGMFLEKSAEASAP